MEVIGTVHVPELSVGAQVCAEANIFEGRSLAIRECIQQQCIDKLLIALLLLIALQCIEYSVRPELTVEEKCGCTIVPVEQHIDLVPRVRVIIDP